MRRRLGFAGGLLGIALTWWVVARATRGPDVPVAAPIVVRTVFVTQADTVRRNETLSDVFGRHRITGRDLYDLVQAAKGEGVDPRRVRADDVYEFRYVLGDAVPEIVRTRLGDDRLLEFRRSDSTGWQGQSVAIDWDTSVRRVEGTIQSSLYETIDALVPDSVLPAGERQRLVWDLADGVFGWVIDFRHDNYEGDRVQVLFERRVSALGDVRFGRILAAKIETRGEENTAYLMAGASGANEYYDAQGRSLKRAFKRYPTDYRRISSGFGQRFHPILKTRRAHLGIDFPAPSGTPIYVTGDGVVTRAGRWDGYGIIVSVRHPKGIETRYAHMRGIAAGIHPGVRVRQGQLIGYVGMTGLATAPHYEFLKNGQNINPRTAVQFGSGEPIAVARRGEFEAVRAEFDRLLARPEPVQLAAGGH
jgi:murein DD-endopeptidase MepM/ murein hydrolase activator NlpD